METFGRRLWECSQLFKRVNSSGLIASHASNDQNIQRICRLDEKDKSYLIEQMTDVNVDQKKFINLIIEVKKLPIAPKLSKTIFHLIPINAHKCQFNMQVHFRTKPAFLARFMKKASQKQMGDMVIGIEHYLKTGEIVTKANFKKVSKLYKLVKI